MIAARGMVIGNVPSGAFVSGKTASPHAETMLIKAAAGRLPDLLKTVKKMEKRLAELEKALALSEEKEE